MYRCSVRNYAAGVNGAQPARYRNADLSKAGEADATLMLTKPMFLKMMTGSANVKDLLFSDELKSSGSKVDLVRFFSLFDKAKGILPIVTP